MKSKGKGDSPFILENILNKTISDLQETVDRQAEEIGFLKIKIRRLEGENKCTQ